MRIRSSIITIIQPRDLRPRRNRRMKVEEVDPIAEHETITPSRTRDRNNNIDDRRLLGTRLEMEVGRPRGIIRAPANHSRQEGLATISPNTTTNLRRRDKDQRMLLPRR